MWNREEVAFRLSALDEQGRSIAALGCAERVFVFFSGFFPDRAPILRSALDRCWNVVIKGNSINVNWDELEGEAEEAAPGSQEEPTAGPAIPAGEAVLCAIDTVRNPTVENSCEAELAAYTTVEMSVFLKMYPPESSTAVSGAEYDLMMAKVHKSAQIEAFKLFLHDLCEAVRLGTDVLQIRAMAVKRS